VFLVLVMGCDDSGTVEAARARAATFLTAHPQGTAIVQVRVGGAPMSAVVGSRWHGADLAEWLAPCGLEADAEADAELILEPGEAPEQLPGRASAASTPSVPEFEDGEAPTTAGGCVGARLATFPFEEPSVRGQRDLVVVRWRPSQVPEPLAQDSGLNGAGAAPRGLWSQAPPYWRVSLEGAPLWGRGFDVEDGRLLLPPQPGARLLEGTLEDADQWARHLTCPADTLSLVRVAIGLIDGDVDTIETVPHDACVKDRVASERAWIRGRPLGSISLREAGTALVVIDVPVGTW